MQRSTYARSYGDLARTLEIWDAGIIRTLGHADGTRLLTWIPAIELAWLGGITETKRQRLLRFLQSRDGTLPHQLQRLVRGWLTHAPSEGLFQAARCAIVTQLMALESAEREVLTSRIIGPCVAVTTAGDSSTEPTGLSPAEQGWLLNLMADLSLDTGG